MTAEPPPWGTPDGDRPTYGSAAGTSGSADPAGRPVYWTPPSGSPSPRADRSGASTPGPISLWNAEAVVVVENLDFLGSGGYDLVSSADVPLGSVRQERSVGGFLFGGAASTSYRVFDADGRLVGSMLRPGSLGRSVFVVSDAAGAEVGTVEQENQFMAPQFRLVTVDGLVMRLTGGQFGSGEWQLVDGLDESVLMGVVHRQFGLGSMLSGSDRFMIELSPQLAGGHRLLALLATICLDYVRDAKKR
jgi:hypothetical protein